MATSKGQAGAKKRAAGKRSAAQRATTAGAEFVCPECGRTFTRAAALGAHRNRAHGVAGQSAQAQKRRGNSERASTGQRGAEATRRAAATEKSRSAGRARAGSSTRARSLARQTGVDRDALLKALFPDGMPPREEVMRAASGWLDDAERLARMR
jgi:hypothetical protein